MIKKTPTTNELIIFRKRKAPSLGLVKKSAADMVSVLSEDGSELDLDMKRIVVATGIRFENELSPSEKKLRLRAIRS